MPVKLIKKHDIENNLFTPIDEVEKRMSKLYMKAKTNEIVKNAEVSSTSNDEQQIKTIQLNPNIQIEKPTISNLLELETNLLNVLDASNYSNDVKISTFASMIEQIIETVKLLKQDPINVHELPYNIETFLKYLSTDENKKISNFFIDKLNLLNRTVKHTSQHNELSKTKNELLAEKYIKEIVNSNEKNVAKIKDLIDVQNEIKRLQITAHEKQNINNYLLHSLHQISFIRLDDDNINEISGINNDDVEDVAVMQPNDVFDDQYDQIKDPYDDVEQLIDLGKFVDENRENISLDRIDKYESKIRGVEEFKSFLDEDDDNAVAEFERHIITDKEKETLSKSKTEETVVETIFTVLEKTNALLLDTETMSTNEKKNAVIASVSVMKVINKSLDSIELPVEEKQEIDVAKSEVERKIRILHTNLDEYDKERSKSHDKLHNEVKKAESKEIVRKNIEDYAKEIKGSVENIRKVTNINPFDVPNFDLKKVVVAEPKVITDSDKIDHTLAFSQKDAVMWFEKAGYHFISKTNYNDKNDKTMLLINNPVTKQKLTTLLNDAFEGNQTSKTELLMKYFIVVVPKIDGVTTFVKQKLQGSGGEKIKKQIKKKSNPTLILSTLNSINNMIEHEKNTDDDEMIDANGVKKFLHKLNIISSKKDKHLNKLHKKRDEILNHLTPNEIVETYEIDEEQPRTKREIALDTTKKILDTTKALLTPVAKTSSSFIRKYIGRTANTITDTARTLRNNTLQYTPIPFNLDLILN